MRQRTSEALVLGVDDLHDRDRIVTLLTPEWGKVRGVARDARRKYSRFSGQLQPLARVSVSWFEREGRDLVRIRDLSMVRPPIRAEGLEDALLYAYLAEHVSVFAQEGEASGPLFRLLDSTLLALRAKVRRDLCARYLECWVLRLAGVFPPPRDCPLCGRELAAAGAVLPEQAEGLVCSACVGTLSRQRVSAAALTFLRRTATQNLERLHEQPPSAKTLAEVEAICRQVRCVFLGHELKSYGVTQQVLQDVKRAERKRPVAT